MGRVALPFLLACAAAIEVSGYELQTHRELTKAAVTHSVIGEDALFARWGLSGSVRTMRLPGSRGPAQLLGQLIADGAEGEDDALRPVNHFFNPWTGKGVGYAAPDWALEESPLVLRQEHSFADARRAYHEALTGPTAELRARALGRMFESLGHVAHLLQDMAQPQHVRGDLHFSLLARSRSRYEIWVERYATSLVSYLPANYPRIYDAARPSRSLSPRDLFTTAASDGVGGGIGIAEFTARNFVSSGTNFSGTPAAPVPRPGFPLPSGEGARVSRIDPHSEFDPIPAGSVMQFVGTPVVDTLFPQRSEFNARTTSFSIFDQDLVAAGKTPVFALNAFNFRTALPLLLPRAVAFSSALFDYFFRGDVELRPDPAHSGSFVLVNLRPEPLRGGVAFYYDALDGTRRPLPGAAWSEMVIPAQDAATGAPGVSPPFRLDEPADAAVAGRYIVAFRGDLGEERQGTGGSTAYGAVLGRMVETVPLEGLYIAGADAQGRIITLRVDETGTHLLSGPDSTGRVKAGTGFDPARSLVDADTEGRHPALLKQARFLDAAGTQYRLQAYVSAAGNAIRDPDTGAYRPMGSTAWVARSDDPAIGNFVFEALVGGPQSAGLRYTRTFTDAKGVRRSESGEIDLPPLPNYDARFKGVDYTAFDRTHRAVLVVTDDGRRVRGFRTISRVDSPAGTWDPSTPYPRTLTSTHHDLSLVLTLGVVPQAAIVIEGTSTTLQRFELGGLYDPSEVLIGLEGCPAHERFASHRERRVTTRSLAGRQRQWVGLFGGQMAGFDVVTDDGSLQDSAWFWIATVEPAGPCRWSVSTTYDETHRDSLRYRTTLELADGELTGTLLSTRLLTVRSTPYPSVRIVDCSNIYIFYCSAQGDPMDDVTEDSGQLEDGEGLELLLAFTAQRDGVVTKHTAGSRSVTRFRGVDITGRSFVGDASPLGEVFFATTDLTTVFHDVRDGRMPRFVPPPNMVRILGAIWL